MQSRRASFIEACVNVAVGFGLATAANYYMLPLFGHAVTFNDSISIGLIMTGISIARSYLLRRAFNWQQYIKPSTNYDHSIVLDSTGKPHFYIDENGYFWYFAQKTHKSEGGDNP